MYKYNVACVIVLKKKLGTLLMERVEMILRPVRYSDEPPQCTV